MDIESPPPSPPVVRLAAVRAYETPQPAAMPSESFMHTPATQEFIAATEIRRPLVPAPVVCHSTVAIKPGIVQVATTQRIQSAPVNAWNENAPPPSRNSVLAGAPPQIKSERVDSTAKVVYGQLDEQ